MELCKRWGYRHLRNRVLENSQNLSEKMRNIQEKLLKIPHFILKGSVNFLELCSVNACTLKKQYS